MVNDIAFVLRLCLAASLLVVGILFITGRTGSFGIASTGSRTLDVRQRVNAFCCCLLFALNSVLSAFDIDSPLWLILVQIGIVAGLVVYVWFLPARKDK